MILLWSWEHAAAAKAVADSVYEEEVGVFSGQLWYISIISSCHSRARLTKRAVFELEDGERLSCMEYFCSASLLRYIGAVECRWIETEDRYRRRSIKGHVEAYIA